MQALYNWQLTQYEPKDILLEFREDPEMAKADADYFRKLLLGVSACADDLGDKLSPCLDRPLAQIDPVELAILRIAAYELLHCPEVPTPVVINEAVSLAKKFGAEQGYGFVNGVLEKLASDTERTL